MFDQLNPAQGQLAASVPVIKGAQVSQMGLH
jgi:hypothetical protein